MIKKTWDEFRATLASGAVSYNEIAEAKKYMFLKVYSDLFHDNFGLPLGSFDFRFHIGRDMTSKATNLRAFAHDGISEEKTKFALIRVDIILKLRKQ